MALEYTHLPDDVEELKHQLLKHAAWVEALKEEVIRLRRWRFGRSSELIDASLAPELPLAGGTAATTALAPRTSESAPIPKLMAVDTPREVRTNRRPPRALPPELPRVILEHAPASRSCPGCGEPLSRLGEDTSEQLDYVPG